MEDGFSNPSRPNQPANKNKILRQKRIKTIQPTTLKRLINDLKKFPNLPNL